MGKNIIFYYIVEGENEKKLIEVLKEKQCIQSGRIKIINVIQESISKSFLRTLEKNTIVVFIFDTDRPEVNCLKCNIQLIKKHKHVKEIFYIPQISCLEEELIYSTNISKIGELLGTSSKKDFKKEFNNCSNLFNKLKDKDFDLDKLWSRNPTGNLSMYYSDSYKIKKKKI